VTRLSLMDVAIIGLSSVLTFVANEARKLAKKTPDEVKE
jgi:hypothetical protein